MDFNPLVTDVPTYPMAALAAKKATLIEAGIPVYDFGTGDPIEPTPPFIREAAANAVPEISQYPTVRGVPELRLAVRDYVKRRFQVELDYDKEILPATGSKEAIYNLPFLLIDPSSNRKTVIYPAPGYPVMERSSRIAGANLHPVELVADNGYLLELEKIDKAILDQTAIAWINYPHNPTGAVCTKGYLEKQVQVAKEHGILLCSDECYADIAFDGYRPPSILEVTKEGVLAFHSCSKRSGMTGYRSGFIAGDQSVLNAYAAFRATVGTAAPVYTQAAAIAAWGDDQHIADRMEIFKNKRDLFVEFFESTGIVFEPVQATFYLWCEAPGGDGASYADKLLEKGIIVSPGAFFGSHCKAYFRIALVPSLDDCAKAINIWRGI